MVFGNERKHLFMLRNVFLSDLVGGKWTPQKTLAIRFHKHEASVPGILAKSKMLLDQKMGRWDDTH